MRRAPAYRWRPTASNRLAFRGSPNLRLDARRLWGVRHGERHERRLPTSARRGNSGHQRRRSVSFEARRGGEKGRGDGERISEKPNACRRRREAGARPIAANGPGGRPDRDEDPGAALGIEAVLDDEPARVDARRGVDSLRITDDPELDRAGRPLRVRGERDTPTEEVRVCRRPRVEAAVVRALKRDARAVSAPARRAGTRRLARCPRAKSAPASRARARSRHQRRDVYDARPAELGHARIEERDRAAIVARLAARHVVERELARRRAPHELVGPGVEECPLGRQEALEGASAGDAGHAVEFAEGVGPRSLERPDHRVEICAMTAPSAAASSSGKSVKLGSATAGARQRDRRSRGAVHCRGARATPGGRGKGARTRARARPRRSRARALSSGEPRRRAGVGAAGSRGGRGLRRVDEPRGPARAGPAATPRRPRDEGGPGAARRARAGRGARRARSA